MLRLCDRCSRPRARRRSLVAGPAAGDTLLEAARQAVRVGAFAVQGVGTQPSYPTLDDALPRVETEDAEVRA